VISPTNLNDVLTQTWELTKLLCDRHYSEKQAQKERGEVLDFDWMQFEHSSATLVILDCRTYTIYEVEQKRLFPPDKIDQLAEVRPKETDILHLSSLADIAARRSCETASFDDVEQVLSFVAKRIRKDQSVVPIIGDPGTIVIVCDGKITKHTTFNGPKDYIETCLEQMG
jgi:hypothetical protein